MSASHPIYETQLDIHQKNILSLFLILRSYDLLLKDAFKKLEKDQTDVTKDKWDIEGNLIFNSDENEQWDIVSETCKNMIATSEQIIATCFEFPTPEYPEELLHEALLDNSTALVYFAKGHLGFAFANVKRYNDMYQNTVSPLKLQFVKAVETAQKCMESLALPNHRIAIQCMLDSQNDDMINLF